MARRTARKDTNMFKLILVVVDTDTLPQRRIGFALSSPGTVPVLAEKNVGAMPHVARKKVSSWRARSAIDTMTKFPL